MAASGADFPASVKKGYQVSGASPESGLLLAISGGPDSVALLHGTLQLWPDRTDRIAVAHVNHGLRADSHTDADFVQSLAAEKKLTCETLTVPPGKIAARSDGSLEEAARKIRYDFLTTTAEQLGLKWIVTAHHADDQAETVLHNIVRGSGLRGLSGMAPARQLSANTHLIRPLLDVNKQDLLAYLRHHNQSYRIDPSNCDEAYTRNRLRNEVLPLLRSHVNNAVTEHLVSLATQARATTETLDAMARAVLTTAMLEQQPSVCRINRRPLQDWPLEFIRHLIVFLWTEQGWPRKKLSRLQIDQLAGMCRDGSPSRIHLPGELTAEVDGDLLRLRRQIETH